MAQKRWTNWLLPPLKRILKMENNKEITRPIVYFGQTTALKKKKSVFLKSHYYYTEISPSFTLKEMNWFLCFQFYSLHSVLHWGPGRTFLKWKPDHRFSSEKTSIGARHQLNKLTDATYQTSSHSIPNFKCEVPFLSPLPSAPCSTIIIIITILTIKTWQVPKAQGLTT